jgi:hypothetical protein
MIRGHLDVQMHRLRIFERLIGIIGR